MLSAQRVQEPMLLLYLLTHAWQESDVGHLYRLRWEIEPCFEPSGVSYSKINEFNTGGISLKALRMQQVGKLRPVFAGLVLVCGLSIQGRGGQSARPSSGVSRSQTVPQG